MRTVGAVERLFQRFVEVVGEAGYIPMSGQIVDATLAAGPTQRNSEAKKAVIKAGRIPAERKNRPAKPALAAPCSAQTAHSQLGCLIPALWSSTLEPFFSAGNTVVFEVVTGGFAGSLHHSALWLWRPKV